MAPRATGRTRARYELDRLWARGRWNIAVAVVEAAGTFYAGWLTRHCDLGVQVGAIAAAALMIPVVMSFGAFVALIPSSVLTQRTEARDELERISDTATGREDLGRRCQEL